MNDEVDDYCDDHDHGEDDDHDHGENDDHDHCDDQDPKDNVLGLTSLAG